jgi:hypothetical protein
LQSEHILYKMALEYDFPICSRYFFMILEII